MRTLNWVILVCCGTVIVGCDGKTAVGAAGVGGEQGKASSGSSSTSCATGAERCACYGNATCNADLTCASGLCVVMPGVSSSGGTASIFAGGGTSSRGGSASTGDGGAPSAGAPGIGGATRMSGGAPSTGGVTSKGGAATGGASVGGSGSVVGGSSGAGGVLASCEGIAIPAPTADTCNGVLIEAGPFPVDMVILMDRSISNSYAVGSDTATPAGLGQVRRWDVLTAAMQSLVISPDAATIGVSITFFSVTGGSNDTVNCNAADYASPTVPLALLRTNGSPIVSAMQAVTPAGLAPTVPALTGTFQYAMTEKQRDPTREKVVVMISDGFPTQCTLKSPSDVTTVIAEAAAAPVPIRTFIIGVGSPISLDAAKFNLLNYARAGNTGTPPYVLEESAGADAVQQQLVSTLLNIAHSPTACQYLVSPPDPSRVALTYLPNAGVQREIPRVAGASTCSKSPYGGWFFDVPNAPTKITTCPCTCATFGAGKVNVVYGCAPTLTIE